MKADKKLVCTRSSAPRVQDTVYKKKLGKHSSNIGKSKKNNLLAYYGVELEYEWARGGGPVDQEKFIERVTNKVNHIDKFLVLPKYDGSLTNGIEWATNPMTPSHWLKNIASLKRFCRLIKRSKPSTIKYGNAGMHVHISANGFVSNSHAIAFAYIIGCNDEDMILKFSERDLDKLRSWASLFDDKMDIEMTFDSMDKYKAVRKSSINTYEVRIFRTTYNPKKIIERLQILDIVRCYTIKSRKEDELTFRQAYNWALPIQQRWLKNQWGYGIRKLEEMLNIKRPSSELPILPLSLNYELRSCA